MSNYFIRLKRMWVILCAITLLFKMLMSNEAFAQPEGIIFDKSNGENSGSTGKMVYQGYTYKVVKVGTQWWMAENLRASNYNDGTEIVHAVTKKEWRKLRKIDTGGWCYYNNDSTIGDKAGILYNWYAVDTGKLAPKGWRVPSKEDFVVLAKNLSVMYDLIENSLKDIVVIDNEKLNNKALRKKISMVYNDTYKWYTYDNSIQENISLDKKALKEKEKWWHWSIDAEQSRVVNKDEWFYIAKKALASHTIRLKRKIISIDYPPQEDIELLAYSENRNPPGYNISGLSILYEGSRGFLAKFEPGRFAKGEYEEAYWTSSEYVGAGKAAIEIFFHRLDALNEPKKYGTVYDKYPFAQQKFFGNYVRCVLN